MREKAASTAEKLEAVRREVRFRNPLYASVQYPEPVSLAKLREGILNPDEVLVEYFLTAAGIYCFAIDKDRHVVRRLPGTAVELEKDLDAFLANIQGALRGESFDRARAHLLYERLLKPLEDRLGEKTIIIVPHGKLAFLPFESLLVRHEGEEKYLTERHRIKYIQSATVLAVLRTMPKRGNVAKSFLGFGDPVYDYESYRRGREEEAGQGEDTKERAFRQWTKRGYLRAGGRLARLEGSGREIREIGALFRRHDLAADCLLRAEAREERAKDRRLAQYAYLHFSTHGILGPRFQAIALSQLPQTEEDGFLTLGEIMNCRYNAELVVLSACETGLGRVDRGEGVTGLTRAVMYAALPAAVVSLWSVSDDGTTELMIQFYRNLLQKGMGKEESLRMAKIAMIRRSHTAEASSDAASLRSVRVLEKKVKGDYGHPFFWAAFVMYGE